MNETIIRDIDSESFRLFLQKELIERCKANPVYSLRMFAKELEIDNSALSKILSGKRNLGKNLIKKLLPKIDISIEDISHITKHEDNGSYEQLAIDTFVVISDWHHYAILELLRVDNYKSDAKWIAKAIGLNINECRAAIERLIRVELLEISDDGILVDISGGKTSNISSDMKDCAFRKMQKQLLEKSIDCIDRVAYEKRNNTSMTMAIDTSKLPEAIIEITKFRRKMGKFLSRSEHRDEVYNLSIALCPLSNINDLNKTIGEKS